ncbi:NUDIX domain-containing protein [Allopontixanthobacter sp.]|uniref:NUDIX domain-containing protein n=1 Tax=Allopontixanthobacter sp. TaxID=2906452 RepID=UPI002ABB15DA|nr:NUDIX domain-containing protein [Allopontixanthobacter sp.]MDZ4307528.1 NUDIX domain-containing protein [Allopontixanthobacter sp.]
MLHLIPAPLHRLAYRVAHALRKRWWQVRQPKISSVSVIATDLEDRLLLVRLTYGSGSWSLPSGGIGRGEEPEAAARREFREETGCEAGTLRFVGIQQDLLHGAHNSVHVYAAKVQGNPAADGREVMDARFFPLHSLPEPLSPFARRRLELWRGSPQE